jgi:TM2 domain-containing membrane protein YozV
MKNKTTVILLALFLWGLGIHRFYLWQKITWIIFVLFFIAYPPFMLIVSCIDFLNFLLMWKETFRKLYNKDLKQCKSCLEYININAIKCKYCWTDN